MQARLHSRSAPDRDPRPSPRAGHPANCKEVDRTRDEAVAAMQQVASTKVVTRWITRVVPIVILGCLGFASYVITARICVDYLRPRHEKGTLATFLVLNYLALALAVATYLRTVFTIVFNPGVVPLGEGAMREKRRRTKGQSARHNNGNDIEAQPYDSGPDPNPDSPGLEEFYTKDVFVCETDGRPRWCSACRTWKPDRAHHSTEVGRCVRKMDHFCPWVGGIVSETSFKFFVQFTAYATLYCAIALAEAAYALNRSIREGNSLDARVIVVIGLAGFFGLFTFFMSMASMRYVFLNLTNVDALDTRRKVYQLAVRVPQGTPPSTQYGTITYPLPDTRAEANGASDVPQLDLPSRDDLATRVFAIVRTEQGENPWDLGLYQNWVSIMGTSVWDWLLPIHHSPCVNHESSVSMYAMDPKLSSLRLRYGLGDVSHDKDGSEVRLRNGHWQAI